MKCPKCGIKGYIISTSLSGDQEQKNYTKCNRPGCEHSHKYYVFIKERYANAPKDNVIQVDFKNRVRK